MEKEVKKREWVKTAAIIFLAVLLVLTFFSNTILNRTLTEVATSEVANGTITAKVRGTGTVSAIGNTEIKSPGTTKIASVKAKAGADVKEGDVLIILGEQSEELEAAQNELDSLKFQLMRDQNSYPTGQSTESIDRLQAALSDAEIAEATAKSEWEKHVSNPDALAQALENLNKAKENTAKCQSILDDKRSNLEADISTWEEVFTNALNAAIAKDPSADPMENEAVKKANTFLNNAKKDLENTYTESDTDYKAYVDAKNAEIAAETEYNKLVSDTSVYQAVYQAAVDKAESIRTQLEAAISSIESSNSSNGQMAQSAYISILETQAKIAKAEEKVKKLSGGEDNAIKAPVSGTISSVEVSPGASVAKGDILCVIEVPDMGYQVSYSVTNDQAKRLKVGDTASVANFYWGSDITATISSIKVDPKEPQTKKLITFDLDGNVTSGSELTIAVGQKSANYDLIVPCSAVRTDSNGSFVLRVEAKNSPLGNRYFVQRVSVEPLATDDVSTAVSGDLSYGDFVVTTSSAPIKSGEQVRMSDLG